MSFETITQGPNGPSGQNSGAAPNGLSFDRQNNLLSSVGNAAQEQLLETVLLALQAQTALSTITTAQNLLSLTLNAGALNRANRTLRFTGYVIYTTPVGTPTLTIALKYGATTLCSITTAATAGSGTNIPLQFEFELSVATTGAAGTIESHGALIANITATAAAATAQYCDTNTAAATAQNLTTSQALAVTIAASTTVTSAQLRFATVEVVA